jgi:uncharacterized protein YaiI (UPF0178 family)
MTIWVDADACPGAIKEILFRAAHRRAVHVVLVANQALKTPASPFIRSVRVGQGFDQADEWIVEQVVPQDLVITADIPLAAQVLEKEGVALSPRGQLFSTDTIKAKLTMRDFMDTLRGSGIHGGGPAPLSAKDRQTFSNHLDRWLTATQRDT